MELTQAGRQRLREVAAAHVGDDRVPGLVVLVAHGDQVHAQALSTVWDEPDGAWSRPPAFGDGAAGLVSTADDLLAFSRMPLRGGDGVLSAAAVAAMTTGQLTPAQKAHGGLTPGFFDTTSWSFCMAVHADGTFGWDGGFGSSWLVDPHHDLVMIVLTHRALDGPERRARTSRSRRRPMRRSAESRWDRTDRSRLRQICPLTSERSAAIITRSARWATDRGGILNISKAVLFS